MSSVNFNGGNISAEDISGVLNAADNDSDSSGLQTGLKSPGQSVTVNLQVDNSGNKAAAELVADGLHKSGKSAEAAAGSGAVNGTGKVNSAGAASKASGLESMSAVGAGVDIAASVRSDLASGVPDIARPENIRPLIDGRRDAQLSLESLIDIFQGKSDADSVKNARSAAQAGANERVKQSNERIEELKSQINKIEEEKNKSFIQKIFDALKTVVQVLGAVVAVATAVLCPNPLTIAAAVLTCMSTVEGLMSEFSDGELSFGNLCAEIDKSLGGDGKIGQIIASVVQAAVGIATSVMSSQGLAQVAKTIQSGVETAKQLAANLQLVEKLQNGVEKFEKAVGVAVAIGEFALEHDPSEFFKNIDDALDLSKLTQSKLLEALLAQMGVDGKELEGVMEALDMASGIHETLNEMFDDIRQTVSEGTAGVAIST